MKCDSDRLMKEWNELQEELSVWSSIINDANGKMEKLSSAIAECQLALSNMEERVEKVRPVEELRLDELPVAVDEVEQLQEYLARARMFTDDANDWSGQLLASDIELAHEPSSQLKSINDRYVLVITHQSLTYILYMLLQTSIEVHEKSWEVTYGTLLNIIT